MKNRELMTPKVQCVSPSETLTAAAQLMRDYDVGALLVCDDEKMPVGLLTDRDITVRATANSLEPDATRVAEVMTPHVVCAYDDDEADESASLMSEFQIRRLPVLDRGKHLVGILSLGDLVSGVEGVQSAEVLRRISEPSPPIDGDPIVD